MRLFHRREAQDNTHGIGASQRDVIFHRISVSDSIYERLNNWAHCSIEELCVPSYCSIEADSYMGKSTFLQEDLLTNRAKARHTRDDSYAFVLVDVQKDGQPRKKLSILCEMRNQLNNQQVSTPIFDYAVSRYSELTGNSEYAKEAGIDEKHLLDAAKNELVQVLTRFIEVGGRQLLSTYLGAANLPPAIAQAFGGGLNSPEEAFAFAVEISLQFLAGIIPAAYSDYRMWHLEHGNLSDLANEVSRLTNSQLLSVIEELLITDLLLERENDNGKKVFALFDSAEYLADTSKHSLSDGLKWALSFAVNPAVFSLFCGTNLNWLYKYASEGQVAFESVAKNDLVLYCEQRGASHRDAEEIATISAGSPAIARMVMDGMATEYGIDQVFAGRFERIFNENFAKMRSELPDAATSLSLILEHGLHSYSDAEIELLMYLCWFDSWNYDMLLSVIPGLSSNHARDYTRVRLKSVDLGNGNHTIHPVLRAGLRSRCDEHVMQAVITDIKRSERYWVHSVFKKEAAQVFAVVAVAAYVKQCQEE